MGKRKILGWSPPSKTKPLVCWPANIKVNPKPYKEVGPYQLVKSYNKAENKNTKPEGSKDETTHRNRGRGD